MQTIGKIKKMMLCFQLQKAYETPDSTWWITCCTQDWDTKTYENNTFFLGCPFMIEYRLPKKLSDGTPVTHHFFDDISELKKAFVAFWLKYDTFTICSSPKIENHVTCPKLAAEYFDRMLYLNGVKHNASNNRGFNL